MTTTAMLIRLIAIIAAIVGVVNLLGIPDNADPGFGFWLLVGAAIGWAIANKMMWAAYNAVLAKVEKGEQLTSDERDLLMSKPDAGSIKSGVPLEQPDPSLLSGSNRSVTKLAVTEESLIQITEWSKLFAKVLDCGMKMGEGPESYSSFGPKLANEYAEEIDRLKAIRDETKALHAALKAVTIPKIINRAHRKLLEWAEAHIKSIVALIEQTEWGLRVVSSDCKDENAIRRMYQSQRNVVNLSAQMAKHFEEFSREIVPVIRQRPEIAERLELPDEVKEALESVADEGL